MRYNPPYPITSVIMHVLAGLVAGAINGLLGIYGLAIALFIYLQFFLYEWVEEQKLRDEMFYELREFAAGYIAGLIACLAIRALGIL